MLNVKKLKQTFIKLYTIFLKYENRYSETDFILNKLSYNEISISFFCSIYFPCYLKSKQILTKAFLLFKFHLKKIYCWMFKDFLPWLKINYFLTGSIIS